jgi:hypothetical protein
VEIAHLHCAQAHVSPPSAVRNDRVAADLASPVAGWEGLVGRGNKAWYNEIRWFDAGHGSRAQEQQIEHQEWMIEFVYEVLQQP